MRPPIRPPARGGLHTLIRRYESGALGLPDHGCFHTITQSSFTAWACARKGWFSEVEGLRSRATPEMHLGTAWDAWKRDVWEWWRVRDEPYPVVGLERCAWCSGTRTMTATGSRSDLEICHPNDQDASESELRTCAGSVDHDGDGCDRCSWTGRSALARAIDGYEAAVEVIGLDPSEVERAADTLRRMADGWLVHYEGGGLQDLAVAGVQVPLARAVPHPRTREPYQPVLYLTEADPVEEVTPLGFPVQAARWRLSRTGERGHAVRWPWYQVGALDVVFRHRGTGTGYAADDKATGRMAGFADAVRVDPQLPGYCWLLEPHAERFGLSGVGGYFYELASTRHQRDPEFLKPKLPSMDDLRAMAKARGIKAPPSKAELMAELGVEEPPPELSRDGSAFTPSWRYARAVEAAGLSLDAYADHLEGLRARVDPECYQRGMDATLPYTPAVGVRYERELYARVVALADRRRAAATAETVLDLDLGFPRTAICKLGARCAYTSVCPTNEPDSEHFRSGFDRHDEQTWGERATPGIGGVNELSAEPDPGSGAEEDEYSEPVAAGF